MFRFKKEHALNKHRRERSIIYLMRWIISRVGGMSVNARSYNRQRWWRKYPWETGYYIMMRIILRILLVNRLIWKIEIEIGQVFPNPDFNSASYPANTSKDKRQSKKQGQKSFGRCAQHIFCNDKCSLIWLCYGMATSFLVMTNT